MSLHIPANLVRLCNFCSLLSHCLVCMLGCYLLLLLGLGYHLIIIVVDDMIIIINVDYIRRRMEGLGYPAPKLCSIRVTLGPEFRVLVS